MLNLAGGPGDLFATTLATLGVGATGPEITPNFPTYQAVQSLAQGLRTTAPALAQTAIETPVETTATPAPAVEVTPPATTPAADALLAPTDTLPDALPGQLDAAYRAPLASNLFPLAGLRGEPPTRELERLQVEATNAVQPLGEQGSHQAFNPNTPAWHMLRAEALTAYRAQSIPAAGPNGPPAGVARPPLDLVV